MAQQAARLLRTDSNNIFTVQARNLDLDQWLGNPLSEKEGKILTASSARYRCRSSIVHERDPGK